MDFDISIEAPWPGPTDWADLAERACEAAAQIAPELDNPRLTASLLFADDAEVHRLNREWRAKDKPTNVLSFPMLERSALLALADHTAHLIVHGLLHLAGHDHETSSEDAAAMENLEIKALALLGIADPYGDDQV